MKRLAVALMMLLPIAASAQNNDAEINDTIPSIVEKIISQRFKTNLKIDFCTSMNATFTENEFDEMTFKLNRLRMDFRGGINQQFSYRVRSSFNKSYVKASTDNIPAALEYANIQWHPKDRFKLTVGKQFLVIGGYEALANSMYVREFSDFNNNMSFYRVAVTGAVKLDQEKNQELLFQISNNRNGKILDMYPAGLPAGVVQTKLPFMTSAAWNGHFADRAVNLIYAAAVAPVAMGEYIYYLSCGNIYEKAPFFAYLDIMYSREEIDTQGRITDLLGGLTTARNVDYLSFIARFDYSFHPKWNVYVKGAYETANVYAANNIYKSGEYLRNWNAQACVEWHPLGKKDGLRLFAHYLYKGYAPGEQARDMNVKMPYTQRASLGVLYVIPVL